jgi:hypothetical protein
LVREEIKRRLNSGNAYYQSVKNLLSTNVKIKIYKIVISRDFVGYGTWFLTLREEHRSRSSENMILTTVRTPKPRERREDWRKFHNERVHNVCSPNVSRMINSGRMR